MLIHFLDAVLLGQVLEVWDPTLLHLGRHQLHIVFLPFHILGNQFLDFLAGFAQEHRWWARLLDKRIEVTLGDVNDRVSTTLNIRVIFGIKPTFLLLLHSDPFGTLFLGEIVDFRFLLQ